MCILSNFTETSSYLNSTAYFTVDKENVSSFSVCRMAPQSFTASMKFLIKEKVECAGITAIGIIEMKEVRW